MYVIGGNECKHMQQARAPLTNIKRSRIALLWNPSNQIPDAHRNCLLGRDFSPVTPTYITSLQEKGGKDCEVTSASYPACNETPSKEMLRELSPPRPPEPKVS